MAHLILFLTLCSLTPDAHAVPVVVAAIGAAVSVVASGGFAALATMAFVKAFAVNLAITAFTGVVNKFAGKKSEPSYAAEAQDRLQTVRSAIETRRIIYGQVLTSGPLVYAESTGANNQYIHLVIPLAGHECEEIGDVYFNDELVGTLDGSGNVTSGRFAGYARIKKYLGTAGQTADADLIAESAGQWTSAHRLRGIAYVYVRLTWSESVFPNGIPSVRCLVKGKKLYDPRTGLTVWSDNWALCVRDYLAADYGLECSSAEINDTAVTAAANISDENVNLDAGGSTTQKRYTCNGTVNLADRPMDIMRQLLSAGAGACVYTQGMYNVFAGAYVTPAISIDESWLSGGVSVNPRRPRRELYNSVRGTYSDPSKGWQPTDFPPITNAAYETQDGGQQIVRDIELPFTTNVVRAQRIAKIHLEKSRQGITVELSCNLKAFKVAVWDTVQLTLERFGFSAKVFLVTGWEFNEAGGVTLTLQEEASAVYDWLWDDATALDPAPDTNLPSPFDIAAPGAPAITEELYETTGSAGVKARALVSWVTPPDAFIVSYELNYKLSADAEWSARPLLRDNADVLNDLEPALWDFRVRSIGVLGNPSAWSPTTTKQIKGLIDPPAAVSGFSVIKTAGIGLAQWVLHPDLDVQINGSIVIRHSPLTTGATWQDGVILESFPGGVISGLVPLITGTYMAKAQDSSGNWSTTTVSFVATEGMVTGFTTVGTLTEHTAFTGAKTNVALDAGLGGIKLDGTTLIDSMVTTVDNWPFIDALGGVSATGSYAFSTYMDLTTSATRRFEADIKALSYDTGDSIDNRLELIDSWNSIDGAVINDCDVTLYARTTNDNPAGSPTWGEWMPFFVADFTCRAAQFKLDFMSGNAQHNIVITELAVLAKIPA